MKDGCWETSLASRLRVSGLSVGQINQGCWQVSARQGLLGCFISSQGDAGWIVMFVSYCFGSQHELEQAWQANPRTLLKVRAPFWPRVIGHIGCFLLTEASECNLINGRDPTGTRRWRIWDTCLFVSNKKSLWMCPKKDVRRVGNRFKPLYSDGLEVYGFVCLSVSYYRSTSIWSKNGKAKNCFFLRFRRVELGRGAKDLHKVQVP